MGSQYVGEKRPEANGILPTREGGVDPTSVLHLRRKEAGTKSWQPATKKRKAKELTTLLSKIHSWEEKGGSKGEKKKQSRAENFGIRRHP